MDHLVGNPYPGRGLVLGQGEDGQLVQVYWIMGRSPNSQNRIFTATGGDVRTEAADESKVQDPSLIIYRAMAEVGDHFVATNGDQTETIVAQLEKAAGPFAFEEALLTRTYEPDAPNFTPRISGLFSLADGGALASLSVLKKAGLDTEDACRHFFRFTPKPGSGRMVTTYMGDGNPIPSFEGEPRVVPITGTPDAIADFFWGALNEQNRVALVVKAIDPATKKSTSVIRNRFLKVA